MLPPLVVPRLLVFRWLLLVLWFLVRPLRRVIVLLQVLNNSNPTAASNKGPDTSPSRTTTPSADPTVQEVPDNASIRGSSSRPCVCPSAGC